MSSFFGLGGAQEVSCQTISGDAEDLIILRDASNRDKHPEAVTAAINRISRPILAKPISDRGETPSEWIEVLVGLLDFGVIRKGDPNFDIAAGTLNYPAVETLRGIGRPVLPQLIKVLEASEPSSTRSRNAIRVIQLVLGGEDVDVANFLLVQAEQAASALGRRRLLGLAENFQ